MPRQERRRATAAFVTIAFSIFLLVAPLVAMAIAQNSPGINFWNPSEYGAARGQETPMVISDAPTGTDEDTSTNETTYRLLATTRNTPASALVEFEIDVGLVPAPVTIGEATLIGTDAWQFEWDIPSSIPDGEYIIRAILYSGSGVTATEVARDEETVLIRSGNPAPNTRGPAADITYPANGDQVGFYVNPDNGSTNTVVQAEYSAGTTFIEALYTVSDPGEPPAWKSCSGPNRVGTSDNSPAGQITMRCILQSADQGAQSVRGLAVVSNESGTRGQPGANTYNVNFNTAGDSIRVFPYRQFATTVTLDRNVRVDPSGGSLGCSAVQTATVLDQNGKPIADMNVDVHAQGPTDQLKFYTGGFLFGPPSSNKPPDKAHAGTELAYSCDEPQEIAAGDQGEHNVPGGSDIKHIETAGSQTTNSGSWSVTLRSDRPGETQLLFWADEDNDDQYCDDEPSVAGSIGWDRPAPAPAGFTPSVTECPIPEPPTQGGTITPSSSSPTNGPGTDDCTIKGTSGDDNIVGTQGNDIICAGAGDDQVDGRAGDDIIRGEDGNDLLDGDIGDDTVDGGSGDDRVEGGTENDVLDGFSGVDVLIGGEGNDSLKGGTAVDGFQGGPGRDVIQSGPGDDVGDGQGGKDIMRGYKGDDILRGGGGGDTIKGMANDDQLTGGSGRDNIQGGAGRDQCSGGGGRDTVRNCEN